MSDTFSPLFIADQKNRDTSFFPIHSRPPAAFNPSPQPAASAGQPFETKAAGTACSKPVVTLQKTGDQVTSIRVQCPCGQIVELACVF